MYRTLASIGKFRRLCGFATPVKHFPYVTTQTLKQKVESKFLPMIRSCDIHSISDAIARILCYWDRELAFLSSSGVLSRQS